MSLTDKKLNYIIMTQIFMMKEISRMSMNLSALNSAVDFVAAEIDAVISILQNPNVNNNDQQAVDALTARLAGMGNALKAALPAEAPVAEPVVEPAPETPAADAGDAPAE